MNRRKRDRTIDHVVGDFNVDGALVAEAGVDDADDFGGGALFVEKHGAGDGDFVVNPSLGFESFYFVMEQRIFLAVFSSRSAGDDDDGRFFGIGAGDGVDHVQAADAVGDAGEADAVEAGIRIGGETGAGFVGHGDGLDGRFVEPREGGECEVAGDAEGVLDAAGVEIGEEELAEGEMGGSGHGSYRKYRMRDGGVGEGERRGFGGFVRRRRIFGDWFIIIGGGVSWGGFGWDFGGFVSLDLICRPGGGERRTTKAQRHKEEQENGWVRFVRERFLLCDLVTWWLN
jgi:hypothetical protein